MRALPDSFLKNNAGTLMLQLSWIKFSAAPVLTTTQLRQLPRRQVVFFLQTYLREGNVFRRPITTEVVTATTTRITKR